MFKHFGKCKNNDFIYNPIFPILTIVDNARAKCTLSRLSGQSELNTTYLLAATIFTISNGIYT